MPREFLRPTLAGPRCAAFLARTRRTSRWWAIRRVRGRARPAGVPARTAAQDIRRHVAAATRRQMSGHLVLAQAGLAIRRVLFDALKESKIKGMAPDPK